MLATVPDAGEKGLIDAPADRVAIMQAQADRFGPADLSRAADLVNTGLTEMRGNSAPRLQLELICARVMLPGAYGDELSLQARLDKLERRAATGGFAAPTAQVAPMAQMAPAAQQIQQAPPMQVAQSAPVAQPAAPEPVQPSPAPPVEVTPSQPAAAPGAWPIPRSFPSAGAPAQAPPAPAPVAAPVPTPAPAPQAAPAPQVTGGQPSVSAQQGAGQVRQLWPQILEAVKNRRRFTWILLSQNGQVAGFDGSTLQVSFINAGARDSFVGSNSDDVLKQALADSLGVDWRVECIVDPSGGTSGGVAAGGGTPPTAAAAGAPRSSRVSSRSSPSGPRRCSRCSRCRPPRRRPSRPRPRSRRRPRRRSPRHPRPPSGPRRSTRPPRSRAAGGRVPAGRLRPGGRRQLHRPLAHPGRPGGEQPGADRP
ncbi:hypothetical protein ACFQ0T_21760 [Kitasatospora gansuensis]